MQGGDQIVAGNREFRLKAMCNRGWAMGNAVGNER